MIPERVMAERFWTKVLITESCWLWTAGRARSYGVWSPPKHTGAARQVAHRFSYESMVGPIPDGLELDHLCQNCLCVNPDHLEPVTHAENMRRARGRKTHCPSGHPLDEANKYIRPTGHYSCRACAREAARVRIGYYERRAS